MKVLCVDDDCLDRFLILEHMRIATNYQVLEASSGNEAMKILETESEISLIISDYQMEDGSGGDLYLFLKKYRLTIPFILVTGRDLMDLKEFKTFQRDNKFNAYFQKPYKKEIFITTVSGILDNKRGSSKKS